MTLPRLLAVGGAHVDRRGRMTGTFVPGASIPGTMREDVGGGAFNALRTAVQLGAKGAMLSMRGVLPLPTHAVASAATATVVASAAARRRRGFNGGGAWACPACARG